MKTTTKRVGETVRGRVETIYAKIFPVDPKTKRPLTPHGFKDASDDPMQWEKWEKDYRNCSWGFPTSHRLFVIDVDKKSGGLETWQELIEKYGQPTTRIVQTQNGGLHIYFRSPDGMEVFNSTSKFGQGIDTRGEGGYVVVPPSQGYTLVNDEDIAIAPTWIVKRLLAMNSPQGAKGHSNTERFVLPLEINNGSRNDVLFRYASSLQSQGKSDDEIRTSVLQVNQEKCVPPIDDDEELDTIIKEALRYAKGASLDDAATLTDSGNAQRFVQRFRDVAQYNRSFDWIAWNGKKWEIDSSHLATQFAEETARAILKDAADMTDPDRRAKAVKWALSSLNRNRLEAMLEISKAHLHTETRDFEDKHKWLLNVENGILNLQTGVLLEHDPYYRMTKVAGTHFDPNAQAPKWQAFVEMIFPDPEVRKYVQKAFGYSLTGNSDERAIYFLEGESGNNGKSTFINVGLLLFGEYGKMTDIEVITSAGQKGLTPLNEEFYNARFVATNELNANVKFNTTQMKALSGNDTIHCNPKHRKPFTFPPTHHLWIFGNHRPEPDKIDDEAFWSRLKRIVFDKEIPSDIRRPMEEVINEFKAELPGILNWAMQGLALYQTEGWQIPQVVTDAVLEYRNEHDYLGQFIEEHFVLEVGGRVDKKILHAHFNEYLHQMGQQAVSMKKLADQLKRFGVEVGGNGRAYYVGIRFPGVAA